MNTRTGTYLVVTAALFFSWLPSAFCLLPSTLPPDVKPGHWAASYVQEALNNSLISLPEDRQFHGEAKVTHAQAVIALAKLAQALETGKWQAQPSRPVSSDVLKPLEHGDWRTQKVTRYELAKTLASMGDYVANGLPRPAADAKDLGKSSVLPPKPTVKLAKTHPAYSSLVYLADAKMITSDSPLLLADNKPLLGSELSRALAQMVIGLTNRFTELGLDEQGSTPDKSFHNKPKK
jgi:hypothetical protein